MTQMFTGRIYLFPLCRLENPARIGSKKQSHHWNQAPCLQTAVGSGSTFRSGGTASAKAGLSRVQGFAALPVQPGPEGPANPPVPQKQDPGSVFHLHRQETCITHGEEGVRCLEARASRSPALLLKLQISMSRLLSRGWDPWLRTACVPTVPLGKACKHLLKAMQRWKASIQHEHKSLKPWGFAYTD